MKRPAKSAGRLLVLEDSNAIHAETEQIQNRIRQRAFELSQARGHSGREVDDWLSAESEIVSVPPAEMIEKDGAYQLRFAIAGIRPDDLRVMASTDQLLVKCEFQHDHNSESGFVHFCEFQSATVFRALQFPQAVDLASMKIQFDGGVLEITAAKEGVVRTAKPRRQPARKPAPRKGSKGTLGAA